MAQVDTKEIPEVKSLRWLANMFPKVEKPQDDSDKLSTCIHLYCTAAADRMTQMAETIDYARTINAENCRLKAELEKVKAERDALAGIVRTISACTHCKHVSLHTSQEPCNRCCEKDNYPYWEFCGAKDTNVPSKSAADTNVTTKEEDHKND